jgi:3'(2'), 5'-bisphosphate nucleotidase
MMADPVILRASAPQPSALIRRFPMSFDPLALDHADLVRRLLPAVLEAGRIEMRHYESGVAVETKADNSPVTVADREAEAVLVAALSEIAPDTPVIAEEGAAGVRIPNAGNAFFLVDPLDGTREFINKRGEFTVNIAMISNGVPVFGIVYAPALGQLYATLAATSSAAATVALQAAAVADCRFEPITTRAPDTQALVAVASRSHMTPEGEAWLARWPIAQRRDAGSSLKFCLIARGEADVYPRHGPTMEWDTAAGDAILRAAGGIVTTLDGQPLPYGKFENGYRNPHFVAWGTRQALAAR